MHIIGGGMHEPQPAGHGHQHYNRSPGPKKTIKPKPRMDEAQRTVLEHVYAQNRYPNIDILTDLSIELGVSLNRLRNWFNNRRAKTSRTKKVSGVSLPEDCQSSEEKNEKEDDAGEQTSAEEESIAFAPRPRKRARSSNPNRTPVPSSPSLSLAPAPALAITQSVASAAADEARILLASCNESMNANQGTDHICWRLASLIANIEVKSTPGTSDSLCALSDIAHSFAQHLQFLSDARGERTRFAQFLCGRLISSILRTKAKYLNNTKRNRITKSLQLFSDRTRRIADIPALSSLPRLFEKPWPDDDEPLGMVMKGTSSEHMAGCHSETALIATARLDYLEGIEQNEHTRNLACFYASNGVTDAEGDEFFDRYIEILLDQRMHRLVTSLLATSFRSRQVRGGYRRQAGSTHTPISCWVARLREHGSDHWANVLQQMCTVQVAPSHPVAGMVASMPLPVPPTGM